MLNPHGKIGEPICNLVDDDRDRESMIREIVDAAMGMDSVALGAAGAVMKLIAANSGECRKAVTNGVEVAPHPDHYQADIVGRALNEHLEGIGNRHGIFDLAQDNGMRVLTVKLLMNLGICSGRGGNDLYDASGREYELKTLNLDNEKLGVTTSHHLKHLTIERYRGGGFIIAAYRRGRLVSIYILHPQALEDQFARWEASLDRGASHLNNPLISISAVRMNGELVYGEPLPTHKPKKAKRKKAERQLVMEGVISSDRRELQSLSSLEAGLEASLRRYRENERIRQEKMAARERKRAMVAAQSQCEMPFA